MATHSCLGSLWCMAHIAAYSEWHHSTMTLNSKISLEHIHTFISRSTHSSTTLYSHAVHLDSEYLNIKDLSSCRLQFKCFNWSPMNDWFVSRYRKRLLQIMNIDHIYNDNLFFLESYLKSFSNASWYVASSKCVDLADTRFWIESKEIYANLENFRGYDLYFTDFYQLLDAQFLR